MQKQTQGPDCSGFAGPVLNVGIAPCYIPSRNNPPRLHHPMRCLLPALSIALAMPVSQIAAQAKPCTTPTAACEHWVVFGSGPARSMVYSSYPLDTRNREV